MFILDLTFDPEMLESQRLKRIKLEPSVQ